jgi:hypothetical protein
MACFAKIFLELVAWTPCRTRRTAACSRHPASTSPCESPTLPAEPQFRAHHIDRLAGGGAQATDTSSTKMVPVPYQPCTHIVTLVDAPVLKVTDSFV